MRKILFYINFIFAVCLLLAYSAYFVNPNTSYIPAFFGLTYYIWLAINVFFILIWFFLKVRYSLLSILVIAVGFTLHKKQFATHFSINLNPPDGYFKYMSYNVQLFGLYNWKENKQHRDEVFRYLKKEDPDIITFQEYYEDDLKRFKTTDTLRQIINAKNVHFGVASSLKNTQHWGIATYSKFPIINKGEIKFSKSKGNICIYTDIKIGKDTVRVFNVHFQSNHLHTESIEKIIQGDSTAKVLAFDMLKALKKGYIKRAGQVDTVASAISMSPYPVIVSGDFNDMPISYTYKKLTENLQDAFLNEGGGFGFTYAGKIPFLRIDYILHNDKIDAKNFKVSSKKLSDHYPISVWLKVKEDQSLITEETSSQE